MAKPEEQQANSTNALLAQILNVVQDTNATLKASLVVQKNTADALAGLAPAFAALIKVESDSRDYLKQLVDALSGEGTHVFSVKVEQLAKELAKHLKTGG